MPHHPGEVRLAEIVEDWLASEGRRLGRRHRRDGKDDSGLTVDFTYDGAVPPVALEITRFVDGPEQATIEAARQVEAVLDRFAKAGERGEWEVAVHSGAPVKRLVAPLRAQIAAGKELAIGFDPFISELDPDRDAKRALAGVVSVSRLSDRRHGVFFVVHIADTGPSLEDTLHRKAHALAKCDGYERHLLVHVEAYGGRPPGGSPPHVEVPDAIDVVWLSWGWPHTGRLPRGLARLAHSDSDWEILVSDHDGDSAKEPHPVRDFRGQRRGRRPRVRIPLAKARSRRARSTAMDEDHLYRALQAKDARFDGWFFVGVTSTGIYCRPSCPATTPKRGNVRFYPTAAAAQQAGFRACKRCRPDAAPGSPEWNWRSDVVARAMRLIADGVVDREGVPGLAARLGYSARHLTRQLVAELGVGPLAVARAQRAQTARILIETTDLPFAHVAFAAGFQSIRQFNDAVRDAYALTPTELRQRAAGRDGGPATAGALVVRLPYRQPATLAPSFAHLVGTAVPGVEEWRDGAFRRTLRLPRGPGIATLRPADGYVHCLLRLADVRDLGAAVARCRTLLDLDADPVAADACLGADPALRPLVRARPGIRLARTVDAAELAMRVVLSQQVSTASARTVAGRLAARCGEPVEDPDGGLTRLFPAPDAVAGAGPVPGPASRSRSLLALAEALAAGAVVLDPGADWDEAAKALADLPGVGPWTVAMVRLRGLGDPDAFPASDLGVGHAARALGLPDRVRALEDRSAQWRPWRAYAVHHLWATLDHPAARLPEEAR